MLDWIRQHENILWALGIFSIICFLVSLVVIPWLVIRLPRDHFVRRGRVPVQAVYSTRQMVWFVVKNTVGMVFVFTGVAMLVLPGQGILTILIGVGLMDFPGKHRFERMVLRQGSVLRAMNWLREKAGREPLQQDEPEM